VELTEEQLLARLGAQLEQQLQGLRAQGCPPHILRIWLREERRRCLAHWLPARAQHGDEGGPGGGAAAAEGTAAAAVGYESVRHCLFKLQHEENLELLVLGCLALLGAPVPSWRCSNDEGGGWEDGGGGGAALGLLEARFGARGPEGGAQAFWQALRSCSGGAWFLQSEARRAFVSRLAAALLAGPMTDSERVCTALLAVEAAEAAAGAPEEEAEERRQQGLTEAVAAAVAEEAGGTAGAGPAGAAAGGEQEEEAAGANLRCAERARALAKRLLDGQRANLRLWDAYAQLEAAAGQAKVARKVYDAALAAAEALPPEGRGFLPVLALRYAELELQRGGGDAFRRAHHVCFWYLSGQAYRPYSGRQAQAPEPAAVARARVAFQERFPWLLASGGGALHEVSGAVVCHALVAEVLHGALHGVEGGGVGAAVALMKRLAAAAPPEARAASAHHEHVHVLLCRLLLQLHLAAGGAAGRGRAALPASSAPAPALLRQLLRQALELYPRSQELLVLLVQLEQSTHSLTRLRRDLAAAAARPGAPRHVWQLYLASEALRPGGWVTLQQQLEKAVASCGSGRAAADLSPSSGAHADAGLWRLYVAYMQRSGSAQGARKVFLRGVRECPWSQALWLGGLGAAAGAMGGKELGELLGIMADKEVRQRTDLYEVMLAALEA
jgi:hypothetical protein